MIRLFGILIAWSRGIRLARTQVAFASTTGLIAGLGTTALIAAINLALRGGQGPFGLPLAWTFAALCAIVLVTGVASQLLVVRLTSQAARDLRLRLSSRLLAAPYQVLEQIGSPRLLAAFTDDIASVTAAVSSLPVVIMQLGILLGCLIYLGWLAPAVLVAVVVYMALGIALHAIPMRRSLGHFRQLRVHWDRMFQLFRGLSDGAKELKLDRARRRQFLAEDLGGAVEAIRRHNTWGNGLALAAGNLGQVLFFAFLGLVVFGRFSALQLDAGAAASYALAILFMITPLTILLNTLPTFGRAIVAADNVRALGLSLDGQPGEQLGDAQAVQRWSRLELVGVTHSYRGAGALDAFQVGPLDLVLEPGELVFVIGGNGSGKTTLVKLLTGLYEPDAGELRLDGEPITAANRDDYRQRFAAVFSDFHLFDRLSGGDVATGQRWLAELQLDHKVAIADGRLSTLALSQGQRKRLALLLAYLSDRPLYVFDEWAADQDPAFRHVFYRRILPELRTQGKTVVAITHDDRYFDVADRVIKLDRGRIEHEHVGGGRAARPITSSHLEGVSP
jgi:putative ATP-binding cassette transporter